MRVAIPLFFLFVCSGLNAQLSLSIKAGPNLNTIERLKSMDNFYPKNVPGNAAWQAGLQVEYGFKHWFVYSGLGLMQNSFSLKAPYLVDTVNSERGIPYHIHIGNEKTTYNPLRVTAPLGAGYRFVLSKKIAFRIFGGIYGAYNIGGNIRTEFFDCTTLATACPEPTRKWAETNRKLQFGYQYNTMYNGDLSVTNIGLDAGGDVALGSRLQVAANYQSGLTNEFPRGRGVSGPRFKMKSLAFNIKYAIYRK